MMERYVRQISLEEIGEEGQGKLAQARILVVGVGGLGSPAAMYLAAAGAGHIGLIDDDIVSVSNLQRQVLYTEKDLGRFKAEAAAERLTAMNGGLVVEPMVCRLTAGNVADIVRQYDVVVDGCDNFETRCILDNACLLQGIPYVYGAIQGFEGHVSVFSGETLRYEDVFSQPSGKASPAVLGMTAGVVGCVQAHEVLKLVCGYGTALSGRLWTLDLLTMRSNVIEL